jgi:N-methylhydantoinase A/oxoprolinase/acetone carboxylase beta subunit
VAEAGLVRAVRLMTVERGRDPRDHALVAFGGAGPMHACRVAEELEIERVLVPSAGGVLSALGAALGERRVDRSRAVLVHAGEAGEHAVHETLRELAAEAAHELHDPDAVREVVLDLRLHGQAFELSVPGDHGLDQSVAAFHGEHQRRYGFADRDGRVEVVTARLALRVPGPDPGRPATLDARPVTGPDRVDLGEATCLVPVGWSGAFDADGVLDLRRTA